MIRINQYGGKLVFSPGTDSIKAVADSEYNFNCKMHKLRKCFLCIFI